nr:immunoglobulin light chain junction region [Macaca mulatta]
CQHNFDTPFTF